MPVNLSEETVRVVLRKDDAVNLLAGMVIPPGRIAEELAAHGYMRNVGDPVNPQYDWDREALMSRPLFELLGAYMKLKGSGKPKIITL